MSSSIYVKQRKLYLNRLMTMTIKIKKSDENIRNECKNLWNQEIDMDWLSEEDYII